MNDTTSRRSFLQKSAIATTGLALLSTTALSALSTENPYDGYNPYSEEKTDLRTTILGEHIRVQGIIFDKTGMTPLPNTIVEVWHLSPSSNKFRHRAKLKTNSDGQYNFITDLPAKDEAKARKIFFKLSDGTSEKYTELFVDKTGANISCKHWTDHQVLGDKLLPTTKKPLNTLRINFNISL